MIWWGLVLFLAGMLTGAGIDMALIRYVLPPRYEPREPHRIEGTDILLEPDPAHHGNHCA
jgi:hypothetical protein